MINFKSLWPSSKDRCNPPPCQLKYYTIFGERNSGTNYLKKIVDYNFKLKFTQKYGFKHWYIKNLDPRASKPNTTTDNECLIPLSDPSADETLFLFAIRNPFDWIESMFRKPYHIKKSNGENIGQFIHKKHISCELSCPKKHDKNSMTPWIIDDILGYYFIEESENIITLRNEKNEHFYALQNHVKHFYIVRQENILSDLTKINEELKVTSKKIKLIKYKPPHKNILLSLEDKRQILSFLNNKVDNLYYKNFTGSQTE